jgi:PAS domain S-box-containing protein
LACDLLERRGLTHFGARTYVVFAVVVPWTRPLSEGIDPSRRAFQMAKDHGDPTFAALAARGLSTILLALGHPLDQFEREAQDALEFVQRYGFFLDRLSAPIALARTLRGRTTTFGSLDDGGFTERSFEGRITHQPSRSHLECFYWIRKLQARFFAGNYASAFEAAEKVEAWYATSPALSLFPLEKAECHFYAGLCRASRCEPVGPDAYAKHREALGAHAHELRVWAANCPQNFEDRAALVDAEIARIEGRPLDAMDLYERAIASARANGFVHNEALAHELAARFYAARGLEEIAYLYLRNARRGYLRWGADGKVQQLDQLHPRLRQDERAPGPTSTIEARVEQLDLATVIKMSQAVSGEMAPKKLIDKLMRAAIEQAGAERGLLVSPQSEELRIDAEAIARGQDVAVHVRECSARGAVALPESLIRYTIRTQEAVILDDASTQSPFSADPYIVQGRGRSILCLPLINQGKLIGLLYLENNLAPRVFTPERVTVLKVLASQAAISLENTRLYGDLADREAKIRRLVDANIIGIFVGDLEGRVVEANDAFLRIIGYEREDLVSGRVRRNDLTPPEWRERDIRTLAELNSAGTVRPFEKEYFRKDGSRAPVLVGLTLFKEGGNEAVAFVIDLTERKQAEEALRESERSLRSAIDGIPGLVGILAPNGDVQAVNRQILEYCGQSLKELKNWGTNGTVHPEDLPHVVEVFTKSIASGIPYQLELRLRRFDGQYRSFDIRGVPIRDDSGRVARWYTLLTDIEDRTQALARLHQMQSDFAHMNRVSMMGELAASLSHEITQPIASARNNARAAQNFLGMQPLDLAEVTEALACVVDDVDRAGDIIDRIREQMKKAPPRKERFALNAAINEVLVLARSVIVRNGVSVQTRLAGGLLPIQGDRVQLQQVVLNLIVNAAEAMGSIEVGPRELLISTEQDHTGILVAVRDSGPGIDPTHLERVFGAFYTTKSNGVGMGLAICRSIIDAHGGRLWAQANEPRGVVFQFTLPSREASS